ncbi:hypothetical protein EVAR_62656_1 [Eumeta japonica]|uniref:Uncharacterized protein n=1 Tax=Eumeta variegata TaxID=151549 RepID=A0A4C1Z2I8_EUMVA|nr:hypothetical protein EVAR_62656_1 [Eumeta japonica]
MSKEARHIPRSRRAVTRRRASERVHKYLNRCRVNQGRAPFAESGEARPLFQQPPPPPLTALSSCRRRKKSAVPIVDGRTSGPRRPTRSATPAPSAAGVQPRYFSDRLLQTKRRTTCDSYTKPTYELLKQKSKVKLIKVSKGLGESRSAGPPRRDLPGPARAPPSNGPRSSRIKLTPGVICARVKVL